MREETAMKKIKNMKRNMERGSAPANLLVVIAIIAILIGVHP